MDTDAAISNGASKQKQAYVQIGLLSIGHFFNDFYCNFLPILIPILIPKLGLSLTLSGILVMVMSFSANVLQPFFGYFMDKYNFNRLMPLIIPFGAVFICMTSQADNFIILAVLIALSGLAVSTFHPMAAGLTSRVSPDRRISSCMSLFIAGGNLGFAVAPILLVYFMDSMGMEMLPLLIVPAVLLGVLIQLSGVAKVRFIDEEAAKNMHFDFMAILRNRPLMLLNISMGIRAWVFTAVVTFLPLWTINKGYDSTTGGWLLALYLVGATTGGLIAGVLNDVIGYKKVIAASLFLAIFPTLYFLFSQEADVLFCIALFIAGGLAMAANPGAIVWGQKLLPDNPGMASGMMLGLSFGLGGIGALLTSAAADYVGLTAALAGTALLLIVGTVLAVMTPAEIMRKGAD